MKKIFINSNLNRMLFIIIGILLHNLVSGQNAYFSNRTETVLTYYGFTDDKRKELLIELSDSGYARAMYYLAEKYKHPTKSEIELIKESAEKGFFMAECELGNRYIKGGGCARNQDSAYYWLRKAIEHTDPFVESDKKQYYKTIKTWEGQHNLSVEIERMTTYALAHSIMSQYYMEKGQMEQGLEYAQKGYSLMDKIYLEPKGWTPNSDLYKSLLSSRWNLAVGYLAVAYYAIGDEKKGNKVLSKSTYEVLLSEIEYKEPIEYIIAKRIDAIYNIAGSKPHPIAMDYYLKAIEKNSYFAMREMINDKSIKDKARTLALSGDSIAAMIYLHHQLEINDTTAAFLLLDKIPYKLKFSFSNHFLSDEYIQHALLEFDDVFLLIRKGVLHTDIETLCYMIEHYLNKGVGYPDNTKVVCLYEILLSQHPRYSPKALMKQNVSACYYNLNDYSKALPLMLEICNIYPETSIVIGEILFEGYTGTPDYEKAFDHLKRGEKTKRTNETSSLLFYYLGMCYLKGCGVSKDEAKGFEYMKKAVKCRSVYTKAFLEIAKCYRLERGTQRDLEKAKFYESEAEKYNKEDARLLEDIRRPLE